MARIVRGEAQKRVPMNAKRILLSLFLVLSAGLVGCPDNGSGHENHKAAK